mmetsp:Transcript_4249/g.4211  ORF Transcript_4249/g.4211 Transcript_4249/m.4211 type:complete len:534 (+) Transcript_4249:29-1630(+)
MVEVSLTVGKLDASLALLLTKDHHLIEFPTILLPNGVRAGSIVKIKCDQDLESEKQEQEEFHKIQDEILTTFGTNLPSAPNLKIKNVTQTSCVLEWDTLELGTANLKNLILFKDGKKLGAIPQPLTSKTTKLSGLSIDQTFQFQLRLDTTAGIYLSEAIEVTTHKMTDLSGITVCLGDISANDQFTVEDIENTLKNMGANYPPQDKIKVDTTHYICTRENKQNSEYLKAFDMNIPIIRPEWLKACERERRIVGVRDFYVKDCVLPDILAKNYWQKGTSQGNPTSTEEPKQPVPEDEKKEQDKPVTEVPTVAVDEAEENKNEGEEKSVEETNVPDTEKETNDVESEATTETANDQLEEVKIDGSNDVKVDDKVENETQKDDPASGQDEVDTNAIESNVESETKNEDPKVESTTEAKETSEGSSPPAEKQNDTHKIEARDADNNADENEPTMDEIKLDDKETQISDEPNTESKEAETSENVESAEKEESAKPGNTETEGDGEGENETADQEDSNNASSSTNKKKKKNNKKKNKKK